MAYNTVPASGICYKLSKKDPGSWAHNFNYIGQLLFDSIEDLTGAAPTNMNRP